MSKSNEEAPQVYYIPGNYEDSGGVLGGRLGTRNAVELCVICGPIAFLEFKFLNSDQSHHCNSDAPATCCALYFWNWW